MPAYTLDRSLARETWQALDAFTQGYIEAAMWTLTDSWFECDTCENQPEDWCDGVCTECGGKVREHTDSCDHLGLHDIADETIAAAKAECTAFQETNRTMLDRATEEQGRDDASHGHDFWLTRNRHGAGFWDRGYSAEVSNALTNAAHAEGETDWYIGDDGRVYQS